MHQAWIGSYSTGGTNLGRMIQVSANFAAFSNGTGAGGAVAWKGTVNDLYTNTGPIAQGNTGTGAGRATRSSSGDVPFLGSDTHQFGFYAASGVFTSYLSGGTDSFVSSAGIGNASGGTSYTTDFGTGGAQYAFGTYFIVETYVRRTSAWKKAFINLRRSSAWTSPQIFVRRGAGWTQVGYLIRRGEDPLWKRETEVIVATPGGGWEYGIARWDYDRPLYMGVGYPGWKPGDVGTPIDEEHGIYPILLPNAPAVGPIELPYEPSAKELGWHAREKHLVSSVK